MAKDTKNPLANLIGRKDPQSNGKSANGVH